MIIGDSGWLSAMGVWVFHCGRAHKLGGHVGKGRTVRRYGPGLTGPVVRVCPGGRHAWIETAHGLRRKPYAKEAGR